MLIRPCIPGEELILLDLFRSSVRGLASRDYRPEQIEAWSPAVVTQEMRAQWCERIRSNQPCVAVVDREAAGFAEVQPSGCINQFFVAAPVSGKGIASALMARLHGVASARGTARLFSHVSLTAQPFFARRGFGVVEERLPVVRGVSLRNAVMTKDLVTAARGEWTSR
jgi:putative acetyltransferase